MDYHLGKITQRFRNSGLRLAFNNAKIIPSLVELDPSGRSVTRIGGDIRVRKLLDPCFLGRHNATIGRAGFTDAEMLAIPAGEPIIKCTIRAGKRRS